MDLPHLPTHSCNKLYHLMDQRILCSYHWWLLWPGANRLWKIHVCTHTYIHEHTYTRNAHVNKDTYTHEYMHTGIPTRRYMQHTYILHTCKHTHIPTHIHTYLYIYIFFTTIMAGDGKSSHPPLGVACRDGVISSASELLWPLRLLLYMEVGTRVPFPSFLLGALNRLSP